MAEAMKINHVHLSGPVGQDTGVGFGDVEMAEIQVFVKITTVMEEASEPGQLSCEADFPASERFGPQLPGCFGDRQVQREHAGELLNGEEALQPAHGPQVF